MLSLNHKKGELIVHKLLKQGIFNLLVAAENGQHQKGEVIRILDYIPACILLDEKQQFDDLYLQKLAITFRLNYEYLPDGAPMNMIPEHIISLYAMCHPGNKA